MNYYMKLLFLILPFLVFAEVPKDASSVDALLGHVAQEPILRSDLKRFRDTIEILDCCGLRDKQRMPKKEEKDLLEAYIDEEIMYIEAKNKKISSAGMISEAVSAIHKVAACKKSWLDLGDRYNKQWQTKLRPREGQGVLVRELEKRLMVDKFRSSELVSDSELWRKEARARYPVKIYLE